MLSCPVCQHQMYPYSNLVSKCIFCGLGMTNQLVGQQAVYHRDKEYQQEATLFKNIFQRRVKIINKVINGYGKALEIGCSTGILLSLLKDKGWEVNGVEPSEVSANQAKLKGIKIYQGKFEEINFGDKFDLIILNHTLEHLKDPQQIIKKIYLSLTPKGYLLIDVPNFDSLSSKIFNAHWNLLLTSEHLWHFGFKSLKTLLRQHDFEIKFTQQVSGIWDLGNPLAELIYSLLHFKQRFFNELLTLIPSLIVSKLNVGTDLLVIARKKQ